MPYRQKVQHNMNIVFVLLYLVSLLLVEVLILVTYFSATERWGGQKF